MAKKEIVSATQSAGIAWEDFSGKLLVIEPLELEEGVKTVHGEADAVRANVFVLLGPNEHEVVEDTLIFPKVLVSQTKRRIDSYVVGRLQQGEAKKGQNPPWMLAEATEKDLKKASDFLAKITVKSAGKATESDDDDEPDEDDDDSY